MGLNLGTWDIDHTGLFSGFLWRTDVEGSWKKHSTERKSTQNFIMTVSMAQIRDGESYSCLC